VAYFRDNDVCRVEIYNDSQTIYFIRDENTQELTGLNKIFCTDMIIYREDKKVERIKFFEKPDGIIIPIDQLKEADAFLKDFKWYEKYRPQSKDDIFMWIPIE